MICPIQIVGPKTNHVSMLFSLKTPIQPNKNEYPCPRQQSCDFLMDKIKVKALAGILGAGRIGKEDHKMATDIPRVVSKINLAKLIAVTILICGEYCHPTPFHHSMTLEYCKNSFKL